MKKCLFCLFLFVTGCAPQIGLYRFTLKDCKSSKANILWHATKKNESDYIKLAENGIRPSKHDFLSKRGEPDEIVTLSENNELWQYNEKVWCGYGPMFFIMAPLVLPVCDSYSKISFENDTAVEITFAITDVNSELATEGEKSRYSCPQ